MIMLHNEVTCMFAATPTACYVCVRMYLYVCVHIYVCMWVSDIALHDAIKAEELLQRKVNEFKHVSLFSEDETRDDTEMVHTPL
jgi:hypothetical protein